MIHQIYPIQAEGSLPDARLITYIQDFSENMAVDRRPLVLICPGGGYGHTSDREAEPIALAFLAMGYHAAVLRYSCAPAKYPTALLELASSILLIRRNAEEWHVDADRIIVQGCSAGGHLAACLGMFWDEAFLAGKMGLSAEEHGLLQPNGMILCYPVITSGPFAHNGSFETLLGDGQEELRAKLSLEHQVSEKTPEAFIWGTFEDASVPMENSLLLVGAMRRAGIPVEYHLYPKGCHGLALATPLTATADGRHVQEECATWVELAANWMERRFPQTMRQNP
ncbi:MAG: alpha/beta hydrolase [Muribaculum sp.]|nr:alpha/beta hydrolase [Muribaculum sp.]